MAIRRSWRWILCLLATTVPALAEHGGHHGEHSGMGLHHHPGLPTTVGPIVGPSFSGYGYGYTAPIIVVPPPIFVVATPEPPPWPGPDRLVDVPRLDPRPIAPAARPRKNDPAKSARMIELGDHLFRSGNISRATERYHQAQRADEAAAVPLVRLAQIDLVRGKYAEAADAFRLAEVAQPGWLAGARDIQALYAEPGDFARLVAKLESHLQAHPDDRDAWFVLGANWFLSGRTRKAADVFLRLSDRQPDASLSAFLAAALPERPRAGN